LSQPLEETYHGFPRLSAIGLQLRIETVRAREAGVMLFEKTPILQALQPHDSQDDLLDSANQLILFDLWPDSCVVFDVRRKTGRPSRPISRRPGRRNKASRPALSPPNQPPAVY
jgi:hypothetical protein